MVVWKLIGVLFWVVLIYVLFLVTCSLAVDANKEYEKHSRFYRSLLNGATWLGLKIMRIKVHAAGLEKIPQGTTKLLFVSNHRSNFDPIVTWHVLKQWKPAFVSKKENFEIPVFGRIIRKCCFMAIDRENPRNAIKTIEKAARILKKEEVSIGIYPEGTRSKKGELLPFHNGVFKIAKKAEAPIVVLSVEGTEQISKHYPLRHSDVYFTVLEVLPVDVVLGRRTDELGEDVRMLMENHLIAENGGEKVGSGLSKITYP